MRTIEETPELRWFKVYPPCRMCGKKSDGLLYDRRNESYGDHCKKCAEKRLALSKVVREREQAELSAANNS
jgi:hypothetical protein